MNAYGVRLMNIEFIEVVERFRVMMHEKYDDATNALLRQNGIDPETLYTVAYSSDVEQQTWDMLKVLVDLNPYEAISFRVHDAGEREVVKLSLEEMMA